MKAAEFRRLYANPVPTDSTLTSAQYQEQAASKKPATPRKSACKQSESQQQSECIAWFRSEYPQYAKLLFHIPNGGHRSKRTAAALKREGVLPGIPDLAFCLPLNGFHGLFIEQKVKGNYPSDYQKEMMQLLSDNGYKVAVVYSTEEFKSVIENYLNAA